MWDKYFWQYICFTCETCNISLETKRSTRVMGNFKKLCKDWEFYGKRLQTTKLLSWMHYEHILVTSKISRKRWSDLGVASHSKAFAFSGTKDNNPLYQLLVCRKYFSLEINYKFIFKTNVTFWGNVVYFILNYQISVNIKLVSFFDLLSKWRKQYFAWIFPTSIWIILLPFLAEDVVHSFKCVLYLF